MLETLDVLLHIEEFFQNLFYNIWKNFITIYSKKNNSKTKHLATYDSILHFKNGTLVVV